MRLLWRTIDAFFLAGIMFIAVFFLGGNLMSLALAGTTLHLTIPIVLAMFGLTLIACWKTHDNVVWYRLPVLPWAFHVFRYCLLPQFLLYLLLTNASLIFSWSLFLAIAVGMIYTLLIAGVRYYAP